MIELGQLVNSVDMPVRADVPALINQSFALTNLELPCYKDQFQALQRLRFISETIDLILCTTDGSIEPVHSYYLAFMAPKF